MNLENGPEHIFLIYIEEKKATQYYKREGFQIMWFNCDKNTNFGSIAKSFAESQYRSFIKGLEFSYNGQIIKKNNLGQWPTLFQIGIIPSFCGIDVRVKRGPLVETRTSQICKECGHKTYKTDWCVLEN